jgi:hypothetical protein
MHMLFLKLNLKELYKTSEKNFLIIFIFLSFLSGLNVLHAIENQSTGIDTNGSIVVVWQENTGLGTAIKASSLPTGSSKWETPVTLSSSQVASLPKLIVTANGSDTSAVAIWTEVVDGIYHLYGAMRPSLMGTWTANVLISDANEDVFGNYELMINPTGNLVVTWTALADGKPVLRSCTSTINLGNTWGVKTKINL